MQNKCVCSHDCRNESVINITSDCLTHKHRQPLHLHRYELMCFGLSRRANYCYYNAIGALRWRQKINPKLLPKSRWEIESKEKATESGKQKVTNLAASHIQLQREKWGSHRKMAMKPNLAFNRKSQNCDARSKKCKQRLKKTCLSHNLPTHI